MIFVTGGTGLTGSHLLYDLLKENNRVRAIMRPESDLQIVRKVFSYYTDNADELFERIEWVEADLSNYHSVILAMEGCDYVYHTGALVSFDPSDETDMFLINDSGTENIVNAALQNNIKKLCYVSTIGTLGSAPNGNPSDEDSLWDQNGSHSLYSKSKYLAEMNIWRGIHEGLNAVIVNPSVILGPGHWNRGSSSIFKLVWNGLSYYTNGTTGYVDVRDVSKSMIAIMKSEFSGERFILTSETLTYRTLFNLIADALGKKHAHIYATPFLTSMAWRFDVFKSKFFGAKTRLTRSTANTSHKLLSYSNQKIVDAMGIDFRKVESSIKDICDIFLKETKRNYQ